MGRQFTDPSGFRSQRITTATTTAITTKRTYLHRIVILVAVASAITVQNAAGTAAFVFPASYPVGSYELNLGDITGLTIVTAGASDLLVVFDPRG